MEICDDNTAVEGIKEKRRPANIKSKYGLRQTVQFKTRIPTEQEFLIFFRHLRKEKNRASLNMWTTYSMINSTIKRNYGSSIKLFPQNYSFLKYYETDIKHKAEIFSTNVVQMCVNNKSSQRLCCANIRFIYLSKWHFLGLCIRIGEISSS